jgi:MFS family permease
MKTIIKIIIASSIIYNFGIALFGPLYAIFVEGIGGSILDASGAYTVYVLVTGILLIIFGRFEDRLKNKESILILGLSVITLGNAGYIFITTPLHLFIVQLILGIGAAIMIPAWDATFSTHLDRRREAWEWSLWEGMWRIAAAIGALAGGFVATYFGFKILVTLMAIFSAFSTLLIYIHFKRERAL